MFWPPASVNLSLNAMFAAPAAGGAAGSAPPPPLIASGAAGDSAGVAGANVPGGIENVAACLVLRLAPEHRTKPTMHSAATASTPTLPMPWSGYGWFAPTPIEPGSGSAGSPNAALTSRGVRYVDKDQLCSVRDVSHDSIAGGAM